MGDLIPFPSRATTNQVRMRLMQSLRRSQAQASLDRFHEAAKVGMTPELAKDIDAANQRLIEAWTEV